MDMPIHRHAKQTPIRPTSKNWYRPVLEDSRIGTTPLIKGYAKPIIRQSMKMIKYDINA